MSRLRSNGKSGNNGALSWILAPSVTLVALTASCPCRELHPAVLMMKSAEDRPRGNVTEPLDRTNKRRILTQG